MSVPISREKAMFDAALEVTDPVQRKLFLDQACAGDAELRAAVEELLATQGDAEQFFAESASSLTTLASELESAVAHTEERSELAAEEKPGALIGHYKLLQKIGEGGCGVVYMAEQEQPVRRRVALKVIKLGMDTKNVIARFEAERQALAMMDHPNIARVFDAGATETGRPYFGMELVNGVKVTEYCDQNQLGLEQRLELFIQICQAIQHAHQKGIIHRDIKPSNILVTLHDGVPVPKVIDFGIAKATEERLTEKTLFTAQAQLIGTPNYMSPEQVELSGLGVDTRSDIYSLGVLLYELLTGKTPFDTKELLKSGVDEMRRTLREREPTTPSAKLRTLAGEELTKTAKQRHVEPPQLLSQLRGDVDWIVMKAIEKDRTRRYETANGLAMDVKRFLGNEPVLARPPSRFYQFQKMVRRNRLLFIGIGVIAILLVVSLIIVSASLAKERQSRLEEEQVKQFLEEMLQGVGPNVALGRDTTILREILDQASARIGKQLTNQPAVEAELRSVIGTLYYQTGQLPLAEQMQRAALATRRKLFGAESPEAAALLNDLGLTLMKSGKLSEAEQVTREALGIRQRCFGNENADVATSQNNLAQVYAQTGKLTEGEALARESLATRQRLFGNDSLEVADSLRTMGVILGDKGQWAEAEVMMRKVLEVRRKKLGPEHPWVASALDDVAWAEAANGKQKEALALEQEALAMRQKLLSPENPDVATSLYHVGDRMRQLGNLKDAYPILNAALSIQAKVLGKDNPATLYTMKSLGLIYEAEHNWTEAETVVREVLAAWRKRAGNDDPNTLYALRNLADVYYDEGKWTDAESLRREELASWRKRGGDSDPEALYTLHSLGAAVSAQGKWSQAEEIYREELALQRKRVGNDDPNMLYALRNLGEILECEGKWAEAVSVHQEESALWRKRAGNDDPQTLYALGKLGWALEGVGKWSEAESVYREALASRRNRAGDDDPQTMSEYESLTRVLMHEKKVGETEQFLTEALTAAVVAQPSSSNLLALKVDLMGRQGRWREAVAADSLVVKYQPTDQYGFHTLAALLAVTGNRPAYEALCQKILVTFTNTSDPYIDERIAKDCLFLPDSGVDLEFVDKLADKSVSLGSGKPDAMPYFQVAKAMSAYRLGRYAEAIEWAEKTLKENIIYPNAHAYAILAMAHWQLGDKVVARMMLAKGDLLTPRISPTREAVNLGDSWVAWLEARISLDEAATLIQPPGPTTNQTNSPAQ